MYEKTKCNIDRVFYALPLFPDFKTRQRRNINTSRCR
jgi:hypothetical protein